MGKGGGDAPSPDPNIGRAALKQAKTGEQWLSFTRDAFKVSNERQKELDALTDEVTRMQMGLAKDQASYTKDITNQQLGLARDAADNSKRITDNQLEQAAWFQDLAKEDRARYEGTFVPLENDFIKEASAYGSEDRQNAIAAEARADVMGQAAAARETARREKMSLGVNPDSGRFAATERAGETATALAAAGSQNAARTAVRDKALALKGDIVNLGRGLPAQSAAAAGAGLGASGQALGGQTAAAGLTLGAGNSAIGNAGDAARLGIGTAGAGLESLRAANSQWLASTAIPNAGYGGAMQGYAGQANTLLNQYGLQLDAWKQEQANKNAGIAGIGSALGSIAGMFSFTSDEDLKEDKVPIADGAALEAVKAMPVEEWTYKPGIADEGRHVGTYAQDFQAATGKGDGKSIPAQDAIGITMKAVQDLSHQVDRIEKQIGLGSAMKKPPPVVDRGKQAKPVASQKPAPIKGKAPAKKAGAR